MTRTALRPLLLVLAGLTAGAALLKVVGLAAPPPEREAPVALLLEGYGVEPLGSSPGQSGRNLSHGTIRRFRLTPTGKAAGLELTLVPVRGRTAEDLEMAGFRSSLPELTLVDRVLSVADMEDAKALPPTEQWAFGRGPKNREGAITRFQTCVTPGGSSGVTQRTLGQQMHRERNQALGPSPGITKLLRLSGLIPHSRWECLAVQLKSTRPTEPKQLEKAWRLLEQALKH